MRIAGAGIVAPEVGDDVTADLTPGWRISCADSRV